MLLFCDRYASVPTRTLQNGSREKLQLVVQEGSGGIYPNAFVLCNITYMKVMNLNVFLQKTYCNDMCSKMQSPLYPDMWNGMHRDSCSVQGNSLVLKRVGEVVPTIKRECLLLKNFDNCVKLILGRLWSEEELRRNAITHCWKYAAASVCSVARFVLRIPQFASHRDYVRVVNASEEQIYMDEDSSFLVGPIA